jgi:hypothetical protein
VILGWEYLRIGEPEKARAHFEKQKESPYGRGSIDGLGIFHTYVPAEAFNTWEKGRTAYAGWYD